MTVQSSLPQNNIAGDFYSISHNVIFVLVVIMVIFMKTWKALVALHTSAKGSPYTHTHTHTQKKLLYYHTCSKSQPDHRATGQVSKRERDCGWRWRSASLQHCWFPPAVPVWGCAPVISPHQWECVPYRVYLCSLRPPFIQLPQSQFCSNLYKKQGTEGRGRKRQKSTKYVGEGRKESGALGCKINKRNRQKQMHSPSLLDSFQRTQISGQVRSTYSHRSMSWICIYLHYLN